MEQHLKTKRPTEIVSRRSMSQKTVTNSMEGDPMSRISLQK